MDRHQIGCLAAFLATGLGAGVAAAQTTAADVQAQFEQMRGALAEQERLIEEQRRQLDAQAAALAAHGQELERQRVRLQVMTGSWIPPVELGNLRGGQAGPSSGAVAQVGTDPAPTERVRPVVEALAGEGGVLTPAGQIQVEAGFEYSNTAENVFVFRGVEIVEAVLIGIIEASDSDRNFFSFSGTVRYGITDRLEAELKIPFVYRDDRITRTANLGGQDVQDTVELDGYGLGDIDAAIHYQINDGREDWPFFVANLRVKSDTGTGPFDVDRDAQNVASELATGSGFWAIEPSITAIYPSSPAVFFGNLSYTWNIARDVDTTFGTGASRTAIGEVDPGDAIGASLGVGFSVNPETSFTLGYKHSYVFGTTQEVNDNEVESDEVHVGSLTVGASYRFNEDVSLSFTVEAGVTEAAPDVRVLARVPIVLGDL